MSDNRPFESSFFSKALHGVAGFVMFAAVVYFFAIFVRIMFYVAGFFILRFKENWVESKFFRRLVYVTIIVFALNIFAVCEYATRPYTPVQVVPLAQAAQSQTETLPQKQYEGADKTTQAMIEHYWKLDSECYEHVDESPNISSCDQRDAIYNTLNNFGWCYGKPGEPAYTADWQKCN